MDEKRTNIERRSASLEEIERAGEKLGSSNERSANRRRLKCIGTEAAVGQIGIRAEISTINEFVAFCERRRFSYREGLAVLVRAIPLIEEVAD